MSTKHTAGEWNVSRIYKNPFNSDVLYIINKGQSCSLKESEANQQLISAAPELLKAAMDSQNLADRCNHAMLPPHIQELLQAIDDILKEAINKATI